MSSDGRNRDSDGPKCAGCGTRVAPGSKRCRTCACRGRAPLTADDVVAIRRLLAEGVRAQTVADRYRIGLAAISLIARRKTYADVPEESGVDRAAAVAAWRESVAENRRRGAAIARAARRSRQVA